MTDLNKLVLASANPGKIKELQEWLDKLGISVVPQGDLGIPDIEETGLTFVETPFSRHGMLRPCPIYPLLPMTLVSK